MSTVEELLDAEVSVNMFKLREASRLGIPRGARGTVYRYLLGVALPDKSIEMMVERHQDHEFKSLVRTHEQWKRSGEMRPAPACGTTGAVLAPGVGHQPNHMAGMFPWLTHHDTLFRGAAEGGMTFVGAPNAGFRSPAWIQAGGGDAMRSSLGVGGGGGAAAGGGHAMMRRGTGVTPYSCVTGSAGGSPRHRYATAEGASEPEEGKVKKPPVIFRGSPAEAAAAAAAALAIAGAGEASHVPPPRPTAAHVDATSSQPRIPSTTTPRAAAAAAGPGTTTVTSSTAAEASVSSSAAVASNAPPSSSYSSSPSPSPSSPSTLPTRCFGLASSYSSTVGATRRLGSPLMTVEDLTHGGEYHQHQYSAAEGVFGVGSDGGAAAAMAAEEQVLSWTMSTLQEFGDLPMDMNPKTAWEMIAQWVRRHYVEFPMPMKSNRTTGEGPFFDRQSENAGRTSIGHGNTDDPALESPDQRQQMLMLALAALQVYYSDMTLNEFLHVVRLTLPLEPLYTCNAKDIFFCARALVETLLHHENILQDAECKQTHCGTFLMLFRAVNAPLYLHFYREHVTVTDWVPELLSSFFTGGVLHDEDVLLLWDYYLTDLSAYHRCPLHPYVCLAILMELTEELIEYDREEILYRLHHLPRVDVRGLLRKAVAIQESTAHLV